MDETIYRFITYVKVQPERLEEMKSALRELAQKNLADPNCLRCEAYQVEQKAHNFILTEQWKTKEAYQAHATAAKNCEIYNRIINELSALLDTQELIPC